MTCLCRRRREAEVQLQPIRNPALEGSGWSALSPGRFTPGKERATIVQQAGRASGTVWKGMEGFGPTGIPAVANRCTHYAMPAAITLEYNLLLYNILYYTVIHYTALYYSILYCIVLGYTVLYYTKLYYTILYYSTLYCTILYYTTL
jgi:hypothetical protein